MTAPSPGREAPRCPGCGDTLHWLGAGWGHDKDNFACCLTLYWQGRGLFTASDLLGEPTLPRQARKANPMTAPTPERAEWMFVVTVDGGTQVVPYEPQDPLYKFMWLDESKSDVVAIHEETGYWCVVHNVARCTIRPRARWYRRLLRRIVQWKSEST